jgi:glutaredoxin 3
VRTVVYSKPLCPYCDKAKHLLKSLDIKFETREVGKDLTREQLLEEFEVNGMPQPRSVPQIILNGKYIGGYNELAKYIEDTGFNGTGHGN